MATPGSLSLNVERLNLRFDYWQSSIFWVVMARHGMQYCEESIVNYYQEEGAESLCTVPYIQRALLSRGNAQHGDMYGP
jgi:hypothetical protein